MQSERKLPAPNGFSLVELMVVIFIIGLLATVVLINVLPSQDKAMVVKAKGAVVATDSTAQRPNWWDGFPPVDGVLLNRSQTPFAFVDYDLYEAIKPAGAAR